MEAMNNETDAASSVSSIDEFENSIRFMPYEIITGWRMNSELLYTKNENKLYRKNRPTKNGFAYLCVSCNSRVHLRPDNVCIQQEKYLVHKHKFPELPTKEKEYEQLKVLNIVKNKCCDLFTLINQRKQSVRDIFYDVLTNYPHVEIDFFKHEKTFSEIRNNSLPKNPSTCDEIAKIFEREDITKLIGTTKTGKIFYNGVVESKDHSFCAFSSPSAINLFKKNVKYGERTVIMDGTFAIVPTGEFNQILIVYAVYMEKVIWIF